MQEFQFRINVGEPYAPANQNQWGVKKIFAMAPGSRSISSDPRLSSGRSGKPWAGWSSRRPRRSPGCNTGLAVWHMTSSIKPRPEILIQRHVSTAGPADRRTDARNLPQTVSGKPDMVIASEASSGRQTLELTRQCRADVIVMDVSMPERTGIKAMRCERSSALPSQPGECGLALIEDPHGGRLPLIQIIWNCRLQPDMKVKCSLVWRCLRPCWSDRKKFLSVMRSSHDYLSTGKILQLFSQLFDGTNQLPCFVTFFHCRSGIKAAFQCSAIIGSASGVVCS
jgi:CheY-like chemotaxis protein